MKRESTLLVFSSRVFSNVSNKGRKKRMRKY